MPLALGRRWTLAALLLALTLALYWRTGDHAFLGYDDDVYVTANEHVRGGLSAEGLRWAFTTGHAANWHPLTWLSHQLDVELFGLDARGHHRTNALLHALNAALLFLALAALTGALEASALAAAFFALHPLRVESVAWVAERKDLLAAAFAFACLWAYARYARRGGVGRYALALALFALGLLAKPMLVTLPFVLLLLDAWPLGRWSGRERAGAALLREKLPFLALAAASALVTLRVQRAGGAFGALATVPPGARIANALESAGLYVWKTFVPTGLAPFHPHPALEGSAQAWRASVWLALAFLLAVTAVLVRFRRHAPFALVGWLWFLGTLVPVIGLVQVGLQGWAERYSYLPSVGLVLAGVWSAERLVRGERARRVWRGAALAALAALSLASLRQVRVWRDSRTLFAHSIAVDESAVAHVELGNALEEERDLPGAERHYARARELWPALAGARVNLARVLAAQGRREEAAAELEQALASEPDLPEAHGALGWVLAELGRDAEALVHLRRGVALAPADLALANSLAWVLATSRSSAVPEEARALAESLVARTRGAQLAFLETLAAAEARLGRYEEAAALQARVLERLGERVPAEQRAAVAERARLYASRQPYLKSP